MTGSDKLILLPMPRALAPAAGECRLADGMSIALRGGGAQDLLPVGQRLRDALLRYAGVRLHLSANTLQGAGITLVVGGSTRPGEGYSIDIGAAGVLRVS